MDFNEVIDILKKKFGGEWVFLIRLHPYNVYDAGSFITYTNNIINASYYDDIKKITCCIGYINNRLFKLYV